LAFGSWPGFFFFQAEDGIRDRDVTGVQTCALPIKEKERLNAKLSLLESQLQQVKTNAAQKAKAKANANAARAALATRANALQAVAVAAPGQARKNAVQAVAVAAPGQARKDALQAMAAPGQSRANALKRQATPTRENALKALMAVTNSRPTLRSRARNRARGLLEFISGKSNTMRDAERLEAKAREENKAREEAKARASIPRSPAARLTWR